MILPNDLLRRIIEENTKYVFHFKNKTYPQYAPAHYHIALNAKDNNYIILTYITSQIQNKMKHYKDSPQLLNSLVTIKKSQFVFLKKDSVIDCNTPLYYSKDDLLKNISQDFVPIEVKIPNSLLLDLKNKILSSPFVKQFIKDSLVL